MFTMKLKKLISQIPYAIITDQIEDIDVNNITIDHREIKQGDVFICIKGFTVDGHDFAQEAVENGAIAIIAEKDVQVSVPVIKVKDTNRSLPIIASTFYAAPSHEFPLVGITGTNGKTTTTYLLDAIFREHKQKTGLIGTIEMKIGDQVIPVKNTTPDALSLQRAFYEMNKKQVEVVMMEVSSHALDLGRVYGTDYDIALFTNLSQDHLDYHENMEDYLRAKSLLFSQLGNAYDQDNKKFAIVNMDDPHSKYMIKSTAQHVLTYGYKQDADVKAENVTLQVNGTHFTLETPIGRVQIHSKLIGLFNVYNMLAASSVAVALDLPLNTIKNALEKITGIDGRFEQVAEDGDCTVIVDYAHTSDSLENVLQTIDEFVEGEVYVVVGCGGDRDKTKRPIMAKTALKYAHKAIFTSDNPRTEDPNEILSDMTKGLTDKNYEVIVSRKEAIQKAIRLATPQDVVLIAGKGHETYQEINKIRYDFDDREVAREALRDKEIN